MEHIIWAAPVVITLLIILGSMRVKRATNGDVKRIAFFTFGRGL